jgi:hypothetical protein
MDYGDILSRAWNIVWNNKFMLVLGFLAALGTGGGSGGANANFSFGSGQFEVSPRSADDIAGFFARFGPLILGLVCLIFVVGIVLWLIRLTAQAGLISAAARIDAGESVSFGQAFSAGTGKLGRMVGVNLVMYGPFTLLGLIAASFALFTSGTAILNAAFGGGSGDPEAIFTSLAFFGACLACLACLLIPLMILVSAVYPFAQRGAVLADLSVIESIRHGWNVVRANLADVILLIILFLVLSFVFVMVMSIVLIPFALLAFGPAIVDIVANDAFRAIDALFLVGGVICFGLVAAAVNAILVALRSTAVTLAYQHFVTKPE